MKQKKTSLYEAYTPKKKKTKGKKTKPGRAKPKKYRGQGRP